MSLLVCAFSDNKKLHKYFPKSNKSMPKVFGKRLKVHQEPVEDVALMCCCSGLSKKEKSVLEKKYTQRDIALLCFYKSSVWYKK